MAEATKTKIESLKEKLAKIQASIADEETKEAATKALEAVQEKIKTAVADVVKAEKLDVKVLHGKMISFTVGDTGLMMSLVNGKKTATATTPKAGGTGNTANGKASEYEYKLADGRGPFTTVQEAIAALGIPEAQRPKHNRYERLGAELKKSITQVKKAS